MPRRRGARSIRQRNSGWQLQRHQRGLVAPVFEQAAPLAPGLGLQQRRADRRPGARRPAGSGCGVTTLTLSIWITPSRRAASRTWLRPRRRPGGACRTPARPGRCGGRGRAKSVRTRRLRSHRDGAESSHEADSVGRPVFRATSSCCQADRTCGPGGRDGKRAPALRTRTTEPWRGARSLAARRMFVSADLSGLSQTAKRRCRSSALISPSGSAGRIRTYDQPINSRLLYH